jgi:hypothetical protein
VPAEGEVIERVEGGVGEGRELLGEGLVQLLHLGVGWEAHCFADGGGWDDYFEDDCVSSSCAWVLHDSDDVMRIMLLWVLSLEGERNVGEKNYGAWESGGVGRKGCCGSDDTLTTKCWCVEAHFRRRALVL